MDDLISLREAASILGVHPSTVRLWSNQGILPALRTPGGHRRYRRIDVELWAEYLYGTNLEPKRMVQAVVRGVRMRVADGQLEHESWYQKLDAEARLRYRQSARLLFQSLLAFLATGGENAAREAHAIGFEYASRARQCGLSYVEAAQAFLFFRNTLIETVVAAYRQARVPFDEMLHNIHSFTDRILIALLETYHCLDNHLPVPPVDDE